MSMKEPNYETHFPLVDARHQPTAAEERKIDNNNKPTKRKYRREMSTDDSGTSSSTILASASAGALGRLICHPLDTIKSKIQGSDKVSGFRHAVVSTWKNERLAGFYRGIGIVMVGTIPGTVIYLSAYEYAKKKMLQTTFWKDNYFGVYLLSGLIAEISCCGIFLPVDVIKERLQVQDLRNDYKYKNSLDALRTIFKEEGFRGIYKGYAATIYSFGPFSAIYFALYEKMKQVIPQSNNPSGSNFFVNMISSAIAGACASFATNPLEIGKLRYQTQRSVVSHTVGTIVDGEEVYRSMWHATKSVYQRLGIRGIFRGAGTRIVFHTPSTAITMASYEECKRLWSKVL